MKTRYFRAFEATVTIMGYLATAFGAFIILLWFPVTLSLVYGYPGIFYSLTVFLLSVFTYVLLLLNDPVPKRNSQSLRKIKKK